MFINFLSVLRQVFPLMNHVILQLGEHDKALGILVHKLRDYGAAENYCIINSQGQEMEKRKRLFQLLLAVYLDPSNE